MQKLYIPREKQTGTVCLDWRDLPPTQELCGECGLSQAEEECMEQMWSVFQEAGPAYMIGLAANQLGYPYRIVILPTTRLDMKGGKLHYAGFRMVINPTIERTMPGHIDQIEGCWSVGWKPSSKVSTVGFRVRRAMFVTLNGYQPNGQALGPIKLSSGIAAAAQHEIDHLDRISIVDRAQQLLDNVGKEFDPLSKPNQLVAV